MDFVLTADGFGVVSTVVIVERVDEDFMFRWYYLFLIDILNFWIKNFFNEIITFPQFFAISLLLNLDLANVFLIKIQIMRSNFEFLTISKFHIRITRLIQIINKVQRLIYCHIMLWCVFLISQSLIRLVFNVLLCLILHHNLFIIFIRLLTSQKPYRHPSVH
jgi:hypothetical protein